MTTRPVGIAAGGFGLVLAWLGGAAVARITGATPVVIVLAAGVVLFALAALDGWLSVRRVRVEQLSVPPVATVGDPLRLAIDVRSSRPVWLDVRADRSPLASGWSDGRQWRGDGVFDRRGVVERLAVRVRSGGGLGLVWWERRSERSIAPLLVAAAPHQGEARIDRAPVDADGEQPGAAGAVSGEIDGVRPWREGDSEKFVHWSSSLRSGELVVHDRRRDADERWIVRARSDTDDPDGQAGAARWALEQGLRAGATMFVGIDSDEPVPIPDGDAAARWSATAPLGVAPVPKRAWWRRRAVEPETTARVSARWWSAGATFLSLAMLSTALGHGLLATMVIAAAVVAGAAISARTLVSGEQPVALVRALIGVGALLGLASVAVSTGRLDGLLTFLRGPLPQVLVILVLLHGFECRDRRTIRVGLAIAAVVTMYAAAFRFDGTVGWWLLGFAICFVTGLAQLSGPTVRPDATPVDATVGLAGVGRALGAVATGWTRRVAVSGGALAATVGVLVVVPIPDGPARLTLPTLVEDAERVGQPGALAGPDGEVRDGGDPGDLGGDRAPAGQAGGYTGFSQSMDTSVRGDLGDEVVMRVRAPEPDFWRGQTFARFDGRRWYADEDTGVARRGPTIEIPPALGDTQPAADVVVDRFVQTFHLEADMPNVVFHAYRPVEVVLDADVWTRADGAIRASTLLPDDSVYTVVSARPRVDASLLRRQGMIGERLNDLGRSVLAPFLEVPPSTSPETVALASELADGLTSTYDIVRAYEAWMTANVEYDLDAPLPDPGEDAVHDFLFDSRLGFCEQIASTLAVMLRTQGIPARLATGYVSGTRDRIAGVYEVRASDAHAWVEVWFPETGWQAFDPTAAVPLSADAEIESLGADLAVGVGRYAGDHPVLVGSVVVLGLGGLGALRLLRELRHRRRRGRWGLLQDRFAATARTRGAPIGAPNPRLAEAWTDDDDAEVARLVATRLDRVAFDPTFPDEDDVFVETRKLIGSLPRSDR